MPAVPRRLHVNARANPAALGEHRYGDAPPTDGPAESERGILYTTRAGFLDLAHLRMTIDWTRYCAVKLRQAIDQRQTRFAINGSNGSMFHADLLYLADFETLPPDQQQALADELALRAGERMAYLMLTWHEVATWFGDHTFLFDESPSAFTWDDVTSHLVGLRIAEMALRDTGRPFDRAVTLYLDAELKALGAVDPEQTQQAVDAVDDRWWTAGRPLKRQFDVGLASGKVVPWLVPHLPFAAAGEATPLAVPSTGTVCGRDYSTFCSIRIEPRCAAADRMRRDVPGLGARFDADHDLPLIMASLRTQMRDQFGPLVDRPWPGNGRITVARSHEPASEQ